MGSLATLHRGSFLLDYHRENGFEYLWTHIGFEDDGLLVHTDKRTGVQRICLKTWPNVASATEAVAAGFSKIEWEELREPPPVA
jgi:hypothetical protein